MIDNYNDVMKQWTAPSQCCSNDFFDVISPNCQEHLWAVQKTITILANADYYYTKTEVDKIIKDVLDKNIVTEEDVIRLINERAATRNDLQNLQEQVTTNANAILNRYTKTEVDSLLSSYMTKLDAIKMRDGYAKIENSTIILNSNQT